MAMGLFEVWQLQSDTIKGAVLGGSVAVFGVVLNALVSGWNTHRQLKHDREQKAKERALALRRDIYLGVAEHVQAFFAALTKVGEFSLNDRDLSEGYLKSSHHLAKLQLMGGPDLIRAVSDVTTELGAAMLTLRAERQSLLRSADDLKRLREKIDWQRSEASEIIKAVQSKALAATLSREEFDRLSQMHIRATESSEALARDHDKRLLQLRKDSAALTIRALRESGRIFPKLAPLIAAARTELGEKNDFAVFEYLSSNTQSIKSVLQSETVVERLFGLDPDSVARLVPQDAAAAAPSAPH